MVGVRWLVIATVASVALLVLRPDSARGRVVVTDTVIEILDDVRFIGKDTIATRSLRTLDAIAETFIGNPSIELVEVQASSFARAQACVDYLVGQGVEPQRLVAAGMAERQTAAFLIVRRASDEPPIDSQP